jgi:hypothetical protein
MERKGAVCLDFRYRKGSFLLLRTETGERDVDWKVGGGGGSGTEKIEVYFHHE